MAEGGQEITELKNKFVDFLEREVSLLFSAAARAANKQPSQTLKSPNQHSLFPLSQMMHDI